MGFLKVVMSCCVFTICSRNYLHYARTLMESVAEHEPGVSRFVALCDAPDGISPPIDPAEMEILPMQELGIPGLEEMVSKYTVLELNTAIKPFVFQHLLHSRAFDQVVYLDPDIRLYQDLSPIYRQFEHHRILLTPHLTDPLQDDRHPGELTFLLCGTFNLGFIALRQGQETLRMLDWWAERLRNDCVVDLPHGLFVDQKWANLIPGLFEEVGICRNPGWNVAYWNLSRRDVRKSPDGSHRVNGEPLFFFHFSGVNVEGTRFSSHQDRFTMSNLPPEVLALTRDYCARLQHNGAADYSRIEYAYSRFQSGRKIPDFIRRIYHTHPAEARKFGPVTSAEAEKHWLGYAMETPPGFELLNRAALALYEMRIDLKNAFPDVALGNERPYANWFLDNGANQPDMDPVFVEGVHSKMHRFHFKSGPVQSAPRGHKFRIKLYRLIYQTAWRLQRWVTPLTSMGFRRRIHDFLVRLAYNQRTSTEAPPHIAPPPFGMNLVGYLNAESGVGRAARLSIGAAETAEIPLSLKLFEVGCSSRKMEMPEALPSHDHDYGINLFHINADQIPIVHSHLEPDFFKGHYNIGFWYWELPEFPDEWSEAYQHLDEIWVATSFCQDSISRKSPIPVIKMPPGISVNPDLKLGREYFGLPPDRFLFLTMADGLSYFERKNVIATLEAFERAFDKTNPEALLVIKLINGDLSEEGYAPILKRARQNPSILLIDRYLSRVETDSLLNTCDAVVSLHRAEGFGLPLAEAMYLGKPVMATHWSGNTDFMDHHCAFPVKYTLTELTRDHGPYRKGMHWAEPDLPDAERLMKLLAANGPEVRAVARLGQQRIHTDYGLKSAGERMKTRLAWIRNRAWGAA